MIAHGHDRVCFSWIGEGALQKHKFISMFLYFQTIIKEGMLTKQNNSFQRSKRRYFKLRGRTLYYAKTAKVRHSERSTQVPLLGH
jgi:diacylglycerol kinase (ATP)